MLKKKFTLVALGALGGIFAFGADIKAIESESILVNTHSVTLTCDEAVEQALANSSSIKTADIDLEIKKRAGNNAWNVFIPSVQLTDTLARSDASLRDTVVQGAWQASAMEGKLVPSSMIAQGVEAEGFKDNESSHWTNVAGISIGWNFSLAMIQQIMGTKASYEAGKISMEQTLRDTEVNVRKLFYGLLLAQENLLIQQNSLENARQRFEQAQTNYNHGYVPELAVLQAQVTYENKKPDVTKEECSFRQQIDMFAFLIGYPVGTNITLEGSIEPEYIDADFEHLMSLYSENSLTIQALDKNIESLKHNYDAMNLGNFTPALSVNYKMQPSLIYALDFDRYPKKENWNKSNTFSITLAWDLSNLLPWSVKQQSAKDLKAQLQKLELQKEMALENQKMEIRKAVDTLADAKAHIDSMSRNINLAQKSYDMTLRAYKNGTKELLDVRDAEDQLNQAKLGLASQKFNYISALLDLETQLNTKLVNTTKSGE